MGLHGSIARPGNADLGFLIGVHVGEKEMSEGTTVTTVSLSEIAPGATNPRKTIHQKPYEELRDNIRELGILVPLIVRPDVRGYELVAGSRRFKAATELELETVPVVVRELTDDQVREVRCPRRERW